MPDIQNGSTDQKTPFKLNEPGIQMLNGKLHHSFRGSVIFLSLLHFIPPGMKVRIQRNGDYRDYHGEVKSTHMGLRSHGE